MDLDSIEFTKHFNKTNNDALDKILKESNVCLICKRQVSSFCHSHSIPLNILKKMNLKDGKIIPFQNALMEKRLTHIEKGKKNSSIFRNICQECDQLFFSKIDNMNVIEDEWTNEILRLQAIRILLYKIHRTKEFTYSFYEFSKKGLSTEQILNGQKMDLEDIKYYCKQLENTLSEEKKEYKILFSKTLDYEINFACVNLMKIMVNPFLDTIIVTGDNEEMRIETDDIEGKYYTTIKMDKNRNSNNGKTKIILYSDTESIAGMLLDICFNDMEESEIMNYLSVTLVIFGNNMYGNEKFVKKIRQNCYIFNELNFMKNGNTAIANLTTEDLKIVYSNLANEKFNLFME